MFKILSVTVMSQRIERMHNKSGYRSFIETSLLVYIRFILYCMALT